MAKLIVPRYISASSLYRAKLNSDPDKVFAGSQGMTHEDCARYAGKWVLFIYANERNYALCGAPATFSVPQFYATQAATKSGHISDSLAELAIVRKAQAAGEVINFCTKCGAIYHANEAHDCADVRCEYCGRLIKRTGEAFHVCGDCLRERIGRRIGYHDFDMPIQFEKPEKREKRLHMGMEIEFNIDRAEYANIFAEHIHDTMNTEAENGYIFAHVEADGSLENHGAEVVTMPRTIAGLYKMRDKLNNAFGDIKRRARGYRSDTGGAAYIANNCGVHVHVDRNFLGEDVEKAEVLITRMLCTFPQFFQDLSGRDADIPCDYAKMPSATESEKNNIFKMHKKVIDSRTDRYMALNVRPAATVEFRLFANDGASADEILARADIVQSLFKWGKYASISRGMTAPIAEIFKYIHDRETVKKYVAAHLKTEATEYNYNDIINTLTASEAAAQDERKED